MHRWSARFTAVAGLLLAASMTTSPSTASVAEEPSAAPAPTALTSPAGFTDTVVTALTTPTGMAWTPDGRMLTPKTAASCAWSATDSCWLSRH